MSTEAEVQALTEWRISVQGSCEIDDEYEIAAVRSDFPHGFESCGWAGPRKIIILEGWCDDAEEELEDRARFSDGLRTAETICAALNAKAATPKETP